MRSWFGMYAPARTPAAIVTRLAKEIKKAAENPKFVTALTPQGMQIIASTPDEMLQAMREDSEKWSKVIEAANIPKQ